MLESRTDIELLKLMQDDDRQAFSTIYKRYLMQLVAVAYSKVRNLHTAEDIVQEVFASLWINRKKTEIESLGGYLATAVKYLSISHLRRGDHIKVHLYDNPEEIDAVDNLNAEEIYQGKQLFTLLQQETNRLPEKCKLVFTYSRDHGKSTSEIAEELNISKDTVKSHLKTAVNRLRDGLKVSTLFMIFLR